MSKRSGKCAAAGLVEKARLAPLLVALLVFPALLFMNTACARYKVLVPAATATLVPGRRDMATGESAGVRIAADCNAWSGYPYDLERIMIPMLVSITNKSGKPLRIRYKDFVLTAAGASRYSALPPYRIQGSIEHAMPVNPAFGFNGFYLVPYYRPFYDWDFDDWGGPFDFDLGYYRQNYAVWRVGLPTRDMIRQAIPEGVLRDGGRLSGFLYFPMVEHRNEAVTFTADLVDAETQKTFGKVSISFEVR